ncbi:MAG: phosphoribosylglycinamide formyltransferase [Synechococcus sp. CPC35]|nr:phosphoribosylglycinamide formyltransferase [Synechococcus sp. CPC35]
MGQGPNPASINSSQRKKAEQTPLRIGVMASGSGTNFEALAQAILRGDLNADIRLLVVNNPGCGAQQRAERLGIDVDVLDHRVHQDREALDRQLLSRFHAAAVEVVVMAGWMRIVTDGLIEGFPGRLLNIHPSLLPSFRGLDAVGQALAAGVRISGCTVHLVTSELDSGPIVAQAAVPVLETDDHASLTRRIQVEEHKLLPMALTKLMPQWRQG